MYRISFDDIKFVTEDPSLESQYTIDVYTSIVYRLTDECSHSSVTTLKHHKNIADILSTYQIGFIGNSHTKHVYKISELRQMSSNMFNESLVIPMFMLKIQF